MNVLQNARDFLALLDRVEQLEARVADLEMERINHIQDRRELMRMVFSDVDEVR